MSKLITFKGQLPVGEQEKIHLSTNDGLTGYRINKFQMIPAAPGTANYEFVGKIYLTDQTGNITTTIDFNDTDLIGAIYQSGKSSENVQEIVVILDKETFNQNIFIYITDASGATNPCNYYIELEKFKIDIDTSTYHTLKNIRSKKQ